MFDFKKEDNKYLILKNQKNLFIENRCYLYAKSENMATKIVDEIKALGYLDLKKLPLTSLAFFAVSLNSKDKNDIINYLIESINFDSILYRPENDNALKILMDKNYNYYIISFSKVFSIQLEIIHGTLGSQKKLNNNILKKNFSSFDCFSLTLLYKITKMTNSIILSYYFMLKKYGIKKLENLTNLESHYQNSKWGLTKEQELNNQNFLLTLKNFSIFLKTL